MEKIKKDFLKEKLRVLITGLGSYVTFTSQASRRMIKPRMSIQLLTQQMHYIGNKSFLIVLLASIMVGAVFGIQFGEIFKMFKAESMIGAAASFALSNELAPIVGSFLVTGRAGSAMAAEIATMKVNDQIDAMKVMSVDPYSYLIAPRVAASIIMMPLLSGFFLLFGVISAFAIGVGIYDVDIGVFIDNIRTITSPGDIISGLQKAMIFGAIFSTVGCYKGFNAGRGAKGVGKATTQAVVTSLIAILISDFFISYIQMQM